MKKTSILKIPEVSTPAATFQKFRLLRRQSCLNFPPIGYGDKNN